MILPVAGDSLSPMRRDVLGTPGSTTREIVETVGGDDIRKFLSINPQPAAFEQNSRKNLLVVLQEIFITNPSFVAIDPGRTNLSVARQPVPENPQHSLFESLLRQNFADV